jgi:hypothetical protein
MILNPRDLRWILTLQQTTEDQTIWMTSAQTGFPLEKEADEVTNSKDVQMGRHTARYLHPVISAYIADWEAELISTGTQPPPLAQSVIDLENEWSTDSNIRITLREDSLKEALPTSDNGLGWVQIQQKSLRWEENIQGSTVITHAGLTTLVHPTQGWTIASGTWNVLRTKWGLTSETLQIIHESCTSQRQLETANIFTPTRHILQIIKRVWRVEGVHGLPAIAAPTFFPKATKNKDTCRRSGRRRHEDNSIYLGLDGRKGQRGQNRHP